MWFYVPSGQVYGNQEWKQKWPSLTTCQLGNLYFLSLWLWDTEIWGPHFKGGIIAFGSHYGLPKWLSDKESPAHAGDVRNVGLISLVREVPLEKGVATHSGIIDLKFSMNSGAWRATVCGVTKSWTWLSTHASLHYSCQLGTLGSSCWGAGRRAKRQHLVEVIRADGPAKAALQRLEVCSALWPAPPLLLESCEHPVFQPVLTCCDDGC